MLLLSTLAGFAGHVHLVRLSGESATLLRDRREAEVAEELNRRLDALLERGTAEAERLAGLPLPDDPGRAAAALLDEAGRAGVAAVAVYDENGSLLSWDGVHRGPVPDLVTRGERTLAYGERPLFSYLYFIAPREEGGGTAMAAVLLRSDLPPGLEARGDDFVSRFGRATGETIRVSRAERAAGEGVWDYGWEDETLFSVSVERPPEAVLLRDALLLWVRIAAAGAALAWLLLALGGRHLPAHRASAAFGLLALAAVLPLGAILGEPALFSPHAFLLPGVEATLGRLLFVGAAGVAAFGIFRPARPWGDPLWAAMGVAVLFPLVGALLAHSPTRGLLAGPEGPWVLLAIGQSIALILVALLLLGRAPSRAVPGATRSLWPVLGIFSAAALGGAAAVAVRMTGTFPPWGLVAWGLPAYLLARRIGGPGDWRGSLAHRGAAVLLGVSAALPLAWSGRVEARMAVGEEELARLGVRVDPYLDFLLMRLGRHLGERDLEGEEPVAILYRSWVSSGLAEEGYPLWMTIWTEGGIPAEELRIGVAGPRPAVADDFLDRAREEGAVTVRRFDMADAHYIATVPLEGGRVATAVVPPRREPRAAAALGPLFGRDAGAEAGELTLIPLLPGDELAMDDRVRWSRTGDGWKARLGLVYPDRLYHAYFDVDVPSAPVAAARAFLLLVLLLALTLALDAAGRTVAEGSRLRPREWTAVLSSFRARVTLALFGFFVLSLAIFGTLAYRTLSGAAVRTARALATRVAEEGAGWYVEVGGSMELLARRVGSDVLEYREGALRGGSVDELVELGLYEGWVPPEVYQALSARQDLSATTRGSLGDWDYVTGYRRLPDGGVLAAPVPQAAGAVAVRRREVADLLGFAVVMGGLLSLGLALLVGRTLTRPIHTLQVASERVGAGNLGVRLPEGRNDEFGAVFSAFNRMVSRLRRARRNLLRSSRRTRAIVEEAATGVIALDPAGRVTLVNPRARRLLQRPIREGQPVAPDGEGPGGEVARWLRRYFRDGLREATTEIQVGDRRIRIRARRISRTGPPGGAVVSLEDVTDELRSERILAWGEMAQQVAHEVKNPLTPIKLSVQHIRRAWEDRRPDFEAILARNVEAVLTEIDRLAAIARGFSRFAAPGPAEARPLEPVDAGTVVEEVLALYAGGEGPVRFESGVASDLPPLRGRETELKEVLVNLLENARAAIPRRGRVLVEAERLDDAIELRVRDDGTGISPEILPRIFEPQFSTRSSGTGLGLAIVRRLVESWGGKVDAESRAGEGTTVRVRVPLWDDGGGLPEPGPAAPD